VGYCDEKCQLEDWKGKHHKDCHRLSTLQQSKRAAKTTMGNSSMGNSSSSEDSTGASEQKQKAPKWEVLDRGRRYFSKADPLLPSTCQVTLFSPTTRAGKSPARVLRSCLAKSAGRKSAGRKSASVTWPKGFASFQERAMRELCKFLISPDETVQQAISRLKLSAKEAYAYEDLECILNALNQVSRLASILKARGAYYIFRLQKSLLEHLATPLTEYKAGSRSPKRKRRRIAAKNKALALTTCDMQVVCSA
jgi:hypothetical protein